MAPGAPVRSTSDEPTIEETPMSWQMLAGGVAAVGAIPAAYDAWMRRAVRRRYPPVGRAITVEGVRLHVVVRGEGRPVVFLHGSHGEFTDFTGRLLERAERDFRVVIPDRPGHGFSERGHERASVHVQLRLLRAALAELGIAHPVLVAHAWSGFLALAWALEHPEDLSGVVLLNPLCYIDEGTRSTDAHVMVTSTMALRLPGVLRPFVAYRLWKSFVRARVAPEPLPPEAPEAVLAYRLWRPAQRRARVEDFAVVTETTPELSARYGAIAVPLLIVVGDGDRVASPARHGYRLHNHVHHSHLEVLTGAGHLVHLTRPEAVMQAIHRCWELAHERVAERGALPREREFIG